MTLQKTLLWSALFSSTLGLTACGGGSSGSSFSLSNTISGVVADGYLGNATVCLDLNKNKLCDVGEPSSITATDGSGAYSLNATAQQIANNPLLVIITTSTTDSDLNGNTINRPYTLSAPAGKFAFISPISTMLQAKLEQNPTITLEQAEISLKSDLGITQANSVDLYKDFIAESKNPNSNQQNEYRILHQSAQVIARVSADFIAQIKTQITLGDEAEKTLTRLVTESVLKELSGVSSSARTHIESGSEVSTGFADTTVTSIAKGKVAHINRLYFEEKEAEYKEEENLNISSLKEAVSSGDITAISYSFEQFEAFDKQGNPQGLQNNFGTNISIFSTTPGGATMQYAHKEANDFLGSATTVQAIKTTLDSFLETEYLSITNNSDGTMTFITASGNEQLRITRFSTLPLAGITKDLNEVTEEGSSTLTGEVTFQKGDIKYSFSYTETPILHKENIHTKTYSSLCPEPIGPNDFPSCYEGKPWWIFSSTPPTNFTDIVAELTSPKASYSLTHSGYIITYKKEEGTYCKDENGTCKAGTIKKIDPITTGVLADKTQYLLIPEMYIDGDKVKIEYSIYLEDKTTGKIIERSDYIQQDATPSIGEYNAYNLSAIQRIHDAAKASINQP